MGTAVQVGLELLGVVSNMVGLGQSLDSIFGSGGATSTADLASTINTQVQSMISTLYANTREDDANGDLLSLGQDITNYCALSTNPSAAQRVAILTGNGVVQGINFQTDLDNARTCANTLSAAWSNANSQLNGQEVQQIASLYLQLGTLILSVYRETANQQTAAGQDASDTYESIQTLAQALITGAVGPASGSVIPALPIILNARAATTTLVEQTASGTGYQFPGTMWFPWASASLTDTWPQANQAGGWTVTSYDTPYLAPQDSSICQNMLNSFPDVVLAYANSFSEANLQGQGPYPTPAGAYYAAVTTFQNNNGGSGLVIFGQNDQGGLAAQGFLDQINNFQSWYAGYQATVGGLKVLLAPVASTFACDDNGTWTLADYDGDGILDLVYIKTSNVGNPNLCVEVHVASGASNYQTIIAQLVTCVPASQANSGSWQMGEWNGDGNPDLQYVQTSNTPSLTAKVAVQVVFQGSPSSPYTGSGTAGSTFPQGRLGPYLTIYGPGVMPGLSGTLEGLININNQINTDTQNNTQTPTSGNVELNFVALSSDGNFDLLPTPSNVATPFNCQRGQNPGNNTFQQGANNGTWTMANYSQPSGQPPDLVYIMTSNTGSGNVELHILSQASNYQQWILETPTVFPESGASNGTWLLADCDGVGNLDLVYIQTSNTQSGKVEVGRYYSCRPGVTT